MNTFKYGKFIIEFQDKRDGPWMLFKKRLDTVVEALDEREKLVGKRHIIDAVVRRNDLAKRKEAPKSSYGNKRKKGKKTTKKDYSRRAKS